MQKREKVDEFQKRVNDLLDEFQQLADDLMAYSISCHRAKVMLKRYNRMLNLHMDVNRSLNAAVNEMRYTNECIRGEI